MNELSHRLVISLFVSALLLASHAGAQPLLFEDFEDGVADLFEPQDDLWEVTEGVYHCHATGYNYYSRSFAGNSSWMDYVFECDIMVDGCIDQMVFVRLQDSDNFYEINVRGDPFNDVFLFKWIDGAQNFLHSTPFPNQTGTWKHYRISVVGNEITVVFDGSELFVYTDETEPFLFGGISLVCHTGGSIQWQDAYYDNVLVTLPVVSTAIGSWSSVKALYR